MPREGDFGRPSTRRENDAWDRLLRVLFEDFPDTYHHPQLLTKFSSFNLALEKSIALD
jgi:hypothetical protein